MDMSNTYTDRTYKYQNDTPFQKWMKIQNGNKMVTPNADDMFIKMTNGPIGETKKKNPYLASLPSEKLRSKTSFEVEKLVVAPPN